MGSGGAERVMSELANHFVKKEDISVYLIILTKGEKFYQLRDEVNLIEPAFNHKDFSRITFTVKIFRFLKKSLKTIRPDTILSFGGRYNSFVLLASCRLGIKTFISDRSSPNISYGYFFDLINPKIYNLASGIIAQTQIARDIIRKKTNHRNIKVIGNPIRKIEGQNHQKQNIILNVGRFIPSKQQALLVRVFAEINPADWTLTFLGDGENLKKVKKLASDLNISERIEFLGNVKNPDEYYKKAKIFAFTSNSEGFPNALGEAMSSGLACISFDCEAGPSELVDNGENGFLIKENNHLDYQRKLVQLMKNDKLRNGFGDMAKKTIMKYDIEHISAQVLNFILKE